jgi:hypothetical protein
MFRRPLILAGAALLLLVGAACTTDDASPADPGAANAAAETTPAIEPGTPAPGSNDGGGTVGATGDACDTLAPEAHDAAFVFVTNLRSGDYLESGALVEGCSRTFESNVPWVLVNRDGDVIAESFAMGGGIDGPASFEFTVEYMVEFAQVGHLFVGGEDPSDGEGFPPVTNQIPVVLLP